MSDQFVRFWANMAGFFGAIGFGLWVTILSFVCLNVDRMGPTAFVRLLLCLLPFAPFATALVRADRPEWRRVLGVVVRGMVLGAGSSLLIVLGSLWFLPIGAFALCLTFFPAGALGLVFGVLTVRPSGSRGDSAGRALALLGMAPALLVLGLGIAENLPQSLPGADASLLLFWRAGGGFTLLFLVLCLTASFVVFSRARRRRLATLKPTPREREDFDRP